MTDPFESPMSLGFFLFFLSRKCAQAATKGRYEESKEYADLVSKILEAAKELPSPDKNKD